MNLDLLKQYIGLRYNDYGLDIEHLCKTHGYSSLPMEVGKDTLIDIDDNRIIVWIDADDGIIKEYENT